MQVALPDEVNEITCHDCGAATTIDASPTVEVDPDTGITRVRLLCSGRCGWRGSVFSWRVSPAEYDALYGRAPAGVLPLAVEDRIVPPGPWGYFEVPPSPIPGEAWEIQCPRRIGMQKTQCGAFLIPDPGEVFWYDEFKSAATVGLRCDACGHPPLNYFSWPLTPEQHTAVFGRQVGEYRPDHDPDDPDDFEAAYSIWRTTDQGRLTHFRSLEDLAATEEFELRSATAGELTVKHWPTGAEWDMPEFVAQHEQIVAADPADEDCGEDCGEEDDSDYDSTYDGYHDG